MIEPSTDDVDPRDPRRVECWRRDYARSLGFDETAAALVAGTRIDLHAIEALTERGCPPEIALELLT